MRESPIPVNGAGVAKLKLGEDTVKKCDVPVAACTGPKKVATGCVPDIESDKKSPRK